MITCEHAKQLFDRYLDGDLSSSLHAELHAHQLACQSCQQELAILEACTDVIKHDRREPAMSASFTDRVMAGYQAQQQPTPITAASGVSRWARYTLFAGAPMAAAASIVFAILMVAPAADSGRTTSVAGDAVAQSKTVRQLAMIAGDSPQSPEQQAQLNQIEQVQGSGFMEAFLGSIVDEMGDEMRDTRDQFEYLSVLPHKAAEEAGEVLLPEKPRYVKVASESTPEPAMAGSRGSSRSIFDADFWLPREPAETTVERSEQGDLQSF
jgi:hypothetical protein